MSEQVPNSPARAAVPWLIAAVVVLAGAITAGFVVAYLVASGRAVDPPPIAGTSPTPRGSFSATFTPDTPGSSEKPTDQPRRTPTPSPEITPEPTPFEHVIARGENLRYIAGLYCTTVDAIVELNEITNPNRVQAGQVLLIPGGGCPEETPRP